MGLQLDEAVDHLHAGPFQIARPLDVRRLVEAGFELDQRRDRFAGIGRFDKRLDDRRVLRGAVERLLDRDDAGVGGGLAQELHDHVEAFERMMDDDVLGADCGKAIAAEIADAFGKAGQERFELKIGPLFQYEPAGIGQAKQMIDKDNFRGLEIEVIGDELTQIRRHRTAAEHLDDRAAAAAFEQRLEQAHQILGLFFDFDIAVADDAEETGTDDGMTGEQTVAEESEDIFQRDEARGCPFAGQPHKARQLLGHRQQRRAPSCPRACATAAAPA